MWWFYKAMCGGYVCVRVVVLLSVAFKVQCTLEVCVAWLVSLDRENWRDFNQCGCGHLT